MKVAISNIAWEQHDDPVILDLLKTNGISGIEVAPTKIWRDWNGASHKSAAKYRKIMETNELELPAMQAILFGKPELQIFDTSTHAVFLEHIKLVSDIANGFGSKVLVFGSPKNRKRGQIPNSDAMKIASEFFYKAGEICLDCACCIGLEHNPVEYGCDFVTNVMDAKELVDKVNHEGFKLHVDSAGVHMCGGDIAKVIKSVDGLAHYHISEPMLEPIYGGVVNQRNGVDALRSINYKYWVSIEMKQQKQTELLKKSLQYISDIVQDHP